MCVCVFLFFFKADNSIAQMRGRDVAELPHCTDAWKRRCWDATMHWRVGEKRPSAQKHGREEWELTVMWAQSVSLSRVICQTQTQTTLEHLNNTCSESLTKHIVQHGAHLFGCSNSKQRCWSVCTKQALGLSKFY